MAFLNVIISLRGYSTVIRRLEPTVCITNIETPTEMTWALQVILSLTFGLLAYVRVLSLACKLDNLFADSQQTFVYQLCVMKNPL
jgi:hypothetical protein